jgi:hypothetical protein
MRRSSLVISLVVGALLVPVAVFASHQFNDVPDSHIFHTGITWMKDNNITVGCNAAGTNYCPEDNVTRGEMATFMKRLAENNVVDAATLDGLDSTEVTSLVWASTDAVTGGTFITAGPDAEINSVDIDVPVDGVLVISGSTFVNNNGAATAIYRLRTFVDGSNVDSHQASTELPASGTAGDQANISYTLTVPITAGEHTVSQTVGQGANADYFYNRNHLTVTFTPGGSVSAAPAGDDAGGDPDGN